MWCLTGLPGAIDRMGGNTDYKSKKQTNKQKTMRVLQRCFSRQRVDLGTTVMKGLDDSSYTGIIPSTPESNHETGKLVPKFEV